MTSAYTNLETLLLFSALRGEGSTEGATINFAFNRISEQLKSIPLIRDDPKYDAGRLSPESLRELYRWTLKQEAKAELERQLESDKSHATTNGDASPNTRKRKPPSPPIPTVQDAAKYSHLIPRLVDSLYAKWRSQAVEEIRSLERKYDKLSREISEGEAAQQNEQPKPQPQRDGSATQPPNAPASKEALPVTQTTGNAQPTQNAAATQTSPEKPAEANIQPIPKRNSHAKIDDLINHGPEPQDGPSHRRTSSGTRLPSLQEMAPEPPGYYPPDPVTAAMGMQQPPYAHSPPIAHQSPYASHHAHPSPQLQHAVSRPSSSPRPILPPPKGMNFPPPSPLQHAGSPSMRGPPIPPHQQHYQPPPRSSIGHSPINDRPHAYPPQQQLPPHPVYYPQQQPVYQDRRTSYPTPQPQVAQRYQPAPPLQQVPPHQGGYQLQPWPVDGQQPIRPQQRQPSIPQQHTPRPQQLPPAHHRPAQQPQHPSAPSTALKPQPQQQRHVVSDVIAALATPPRPQRKIVWKSERRPPPVNVPQVPPPPDAYIEPLSPVRARKSPPRQTRATRKREGASSVEHEDSIPAPVANRRTRQTRNRSPHSVVSSQTDDLALTRTRSQSVSTAAGAHQASDDGRGSRSNIKHEPSTPAETVEAPDATHEPSATPATGRMTRGRRGTLTSLPQTQKRKRPDEEAEDVATPPPKPTTVMATRNFAKMASTIMNDITSHKHASYFAGPVRDKDASGYSEITKQPQHLKSIRSAITAGTRAIAAATASDDPAATPTTSKAADGSMTVELERTADLIPPKAIVNGAQLEKEAYRMFANAVMFNPGEDGLVADTREMFEDVEAKIRDWRGADTGVTEEEEEGKGKRRKL